MILHSIYYKTAIEIVIGFKKKQRKIHKRQVTISFICVILTKIVKISRDLVYGQYSIKVPLKICIPQCWELMS